MSWAAIGVAVAGAAVSAGASYAVGQATKPNQPDLASSSAELSNVNAQMLPWRRKLEAAAQIGSKITIDDYPPRAEAQDYVTVPDGYERDIAKSVGLSFAGNPFAGVLGKNKAKTVDVPYNPADWEAGGKYASLGQPAVFKKSVMVTGPKTFDFTGVGAADANAAVAKATAQMQLDLQKKYGEDFAKSNAEQAKLADPEGYAARQKMDELIQKQINRTPDRSIATELDRQIGDQLHAGSGLTAEQQAMLDQSVKSAGNARGGVGAVDFADPLTTGWAGEARQQAGIAKAGGWQASKLTPQDAAYRESQQNMANLSAEVNGRTPESQFASLSAPGATPFTAGQPLPQMPNNSAAGTANALNSYNAQINQQQQQVNPWMAGLSGLLSAGNAVVASRQTA